MGTAILVHSGGGGVTSDELTLTKDKVPAGQTYVGSDTDDDIGTGTAATVPALTVPTNGRVLIPKGYSDGSKYAGNSQATMSAYTITPQTYAQTIDTNGKLVSGNFVVGGYADYSYLLGHQVIFNYGSWGTLASTGLSRYSHGCVVKTVSNWDVVPVTALWSDNSDMSYVALLNKSIDLTPYNKLNFACTGRDKYNSFVVYIRSASLPHGNGYAQASDWESILYIETSIVMGNNQKVVDISKYKGQYFFKVEGSAHRNDMIALLALSLSP